MITALLLSLALLAGEQDALSAARDLYASAAYEDALAALNRVSESSRPPEEARAISQYRAFCLLALGRTTEAERAIETLIARDPMYHPTANDVSPRVRAAFTDVRRRVLPAIIQQTYADAKASFDRKDYDAAAAGFAHTLEVMNDPDAAQIVSQPPLADLRTLAGGFRDLALKAAAPPPPPPAPVVVAPPPPPPVPAAPRIYSAADPNVVPPQIVRQELPAFPGQLQMNRQGVIEVTIDENGAVESAVMRQTVGSNYDSMAVKAAQTWRYTPATVDGRPVKFRKSIQVTIKGSRSEELSRVVFLGDEIDKLIHRCTFFAASGV
jgi:TonB family protein